MQQQLGLKTARPVGEPALHVQAARQGLGLRLGWLVARPEGRPPTAEAELNQQTQPGMVRPEGAPALRVERVYLRQLVARPEDRPLTRVAQLNGCLLHCNNRLGKGPEALQRSGMRAARPVDAPSLQAKKVRGIR